MIDNPQEAEKIVKERYEANLARIKADLAREKREKEYVPNENSDNNIEVLKGREDLILSDETFDRPMGCVKIKNVLKKYQDFTIAECAYIYFKYEGREKVKLTPIEYNILLLLVKNQGRVFSIEQIYEYIWEEEAIGADNTVAVHIRHIREKIEINPKEPKYLKVVWGVGYKIEKI